jgi:hypothetical protein
MSNFLFVKSKSKHFKHLGVLLLLFVFSVGVNAQTTVSGIVSNQSELTPNVTISVKKISKIAKKVSFLKGIIPMANGIANLKSN